MRKKILLIIAAVVGVAALLFGGYHLYYRNQIQTYRTYIPIWEIEDYQFLREENLLAVQWKLDDPLEYYYRDHAAYTFQRASLSKSDHYLASEGKRFREGQEHQGAKKEGEYWYLDVYDVTKDTLKRKRLDIFEVVSKYDASYTPVYVWNVRQIYYNNHYYVKIDVRKGEDGAVESRMLDLSDGQIVDLPENSSNYNFLTGSITTPMYHRFYDGRFDVVLPAGRSLIAGQESNQWLIAKKYPDFYQYLKEKKTVLYDLNSSYNFEKSLSVVPLFFPEGENIYKNLVIDGEYSIDGQEHTVNSLEEFKKYYDPQKDSWKTTTQEKGESE